MDNHFGAIGESVNKRDVYLWNMLGSISFASLSFVFTFLIRYCLGIEELGEFSLAFSNAQLFYTLGLYGLNGIQMTDGKGEYLFSDYYSAKLLSTGMMLFASAALGVFGRYSFHKFCVLLLITFYYAIFSYAEVFQAQLFAKGRLDLAGRSLFLRSTVSILFFAMILIFTKDLIVALIVAIFVQIIVFLLMDYRYLRLYESILIRIKKESILKLLKMGTLLCLSNCLFTLINNSPKYAIDSVGNNWMQGIFGILYIPVMLIALLCSFVYRPIINNLTVAVQERNRDTFVKNIYRVTGIVILFGAFGILVASLCGVQLFSIVFSVDLAEEMKAMYWMILSAVVIGLVNFLYYIVVIIRKNTVILLSALAGGVFCCCMGRRFVSSMNLQGAFMLIAISYIAITIVFAVTLLREVASWRKLDTKIEGVNDSE